MLTPAIYDMRVQRNSPFPDGEDNRWSITVNGAAMDLAGVSILMQVRQYAGEAGDPLIDLNSTDVTGDRIQIIGDEFEIHIAQATLEALVMPPLNPDNKPLTLYYDLRAGPSGSERVYFGGKFIVATGVTR